MIAEIEEAAVVEEARVTTMLRLRPTPITINPRDIDWHNARHENRQGQRARGQLIRPVLTQSPNSPRTDQGGEARLPYGFPRPPSTQLSPIRNLQFPMFTAEEDERGYWLNVAANVEDNPRLQHVNSGRPVMVHASPSSRSAIEASSASFETDDQSSQSFDEQENDALSYTSQLYGSDGDDPEEEAKQDSETESSALGTTRGNQLDDHRDQADPSMARSPHRSHRHRLSFPFRRRRAQECDDPDHINSLQPPTENVDFDGSSEPNPNRHTNDSTISTTESQYATARNSLDDIPPSDPELLARSTPLPSQDFEVRHVTELLEASSPFKNPNERSSTSQIQSDSPASSLIMKRSSGYLRSPFQSLQTAATMSPEKRPRPEPDPIELSESLDNLSLQACRAKKRYKRRSETYPYNQSEADDQSQSYHQDNSNQDIYHSTLSDIPTIQGQAATDQISIDLAPRSSASSLQPSSHASSDELATNSPLRRSLSPLAPPFTPRRTPIQPMLPLTLPVYPFSAVRRTVSFASPTASSSPSPVRSGVHVQNSSYSFNNLPIGSIRTPPPPGTPQYSVYNDHLPASIQPQTPVGLPSNGVPNGGLPGVIVGGAYTAPVRGKSIFIVLFLIPSCIDLMERNDTYHGLDTT